MCFLVASAQHVTVPSHPQACRALAAETKAKGTVMLTQNTQLSAENLEKPCLRHHQQAVGSWRWYPNFSVLHLTFYTIRLTLFALLKVAS